MNVLQQANNLRFVEKMWCGENDYLQWWDRCRIYNVELKTRRTSSLDYARDDKLNVTRIGWQKKTYWIVLLQHQPCVNAQFTIRLSGQVFNDQLKSIF